MPVSSTATFFAHPEFDSETLRNDIAVVKLDTEIALTNCIQPICVAAGQLPNRGLVSGWGRTSEGGAVSRILQQITVNVLGSDCGANVRTTNGSFCAGREDDSNVYDACQGDSGGPLAYLDDGRGWTLIGVVSSGIGCGRSGNPGVYTEVAHYIEFLESHGVKVQGKKEGESESVGSKSPPVLSNSQVGGHFFIVPILFGIFSIP